MSAAWHMPSDHKGEKPLAGLSRAHTACNGPMRMNELLAAFPVAIQALLKGHLSEEALPRGAVCFNAGDIVGRVYFPTSALISLVASSGGDDFVEAGMIGCEGAAGLQSAVWCRPSFTRAIVQVPGTFWSASAERLRQVVQSSEETETLFNDYTAVLWAEAQQLAACNAVHPALQRLARWLLQAADRSQSNHLPLTQEFLGKMIGVRRTSVTVLAQRLQDSGAIKYSRADIVVLDRARLEASACQCYRIIRQLYRREPQNPGAPSVVAHSADIGSKARDADF